MAPHYMNGASLSQSNNIMRKIRKKTRRGWEALNIRYPILQVLATNSRAFLLISALFFIMLIFSILWAWGIPQGIWKTQPLSGVPDNLFSTVIEISVISILVITLIFIKIVFGSEATRLNNNYRLIREHLILSLNIEESKVKLEFDQSEHYTSPAFIESFWRWSRVNREEYFLIEAGSLDIAKLTVKSFGFSQEKDSVVINLGQTSFFDIFFTHYCPDLTVSKVQNSERDEEKSIRSLLSHSLSQHYEESINAIRNNISNKLTTPDYIPSPIGMSGIVMLEVEGVNYVLLRRRDTGDIAARGAIEWSFAGLFESTDWLHTKSINYRELTLKELQDELLQYSATLEHIDFSLKIIGVVINELFLFQPELFSLCSYICTRAEFLAICAELKENTNGEIWVCEVSNIDSEFEELYKCKNLCQPGLVLLKKHLDLIV